MAETNHPKKFALWQRTETEVLLLVVVILSRGDIVYSTAGAFELINATSLFPGHGNTWTVQVLTQLIHTQSTK